MPAVVNQAELWSLLQQEGGGPVAIFNTLSSCRTKRTIDRLVATSKRTVVVPYAAVDVSAIAYLHPSSIIRLRRVDGTWEDARVTDIQISSGGDGRITITADDILRDLATRGQLIADSANGRIVYSVTKTDTPANLITYVLGFAPAFFQLGNVTPTAVITVTLNEMNPYQAMVAIAEAAFAATGTAYELSARLLSGFYKIDLQILNGSAGPADIRTGKNLGGLQRLQSSRDFGQRVVSMGSDSMGPGDNWWQVSSVSVNTYIQLIDINGGPSPLISVAPLTGYYVVDRADGKHAITSTSIVSATECRLNMASTTNISAGDWVRIAFDSSGNPVPYVEYPAAGVSALGVNLIVLRRQAPSRTNWLLNPDLKNWTGSTPDNWTKTGAGVIVKDTTPGNYLTGGASARLSASSITLSQNRNVCIPSVGTWYANWIAFFKVDPTGAVIASSMTNKYDGGLIPLTGAYDFSTQADGQWHSAYQSWKPATGIHNFSMDILLGRIMWFDSAMIYFTEGTPIAIPFIAGSGGAASWLDSKAYISGMPTAPYIYTGRVADLFKLVPADAPYDELLLGKTDNITDYEIGNTLSPRVVSLDEDELDPLQTQVGWSTRRPEISKLIAAR